MTDERSARSERGLEIGMVCDIGRRRSENQDAMLVRDTPHGLLLVVCDGMGGHVGGARASALATEAFASTVATTAGSIDDLLRRGVATALARLREEAAGDPSLADMGTTLVAALARDGELSIVNVGDSRAYLFSGGGLRRVTHDHSLVGELVARGEITEEEARNHPQRNVITRALGPFADDVVPDLFHARLAPDDRLLLCSDGLHGLVEDPEIASVLASGGRPLEAAEELVAMANDRGGIDNITVLLAQPSSGGGGAATNTGTTLPEPPTDPPGMRGAVGKGAPPTPTATPTPAATRRRRGGLLPLFVVSLAILAALGYFLLGPFEEASHPVDTTTVTDSAVPPDAGVRSDSVRIGDTLELTPGVEPGIPWAEPHDEPRRDTLRTNDSTFI